MMRTRAQIVSWSSPRDSGNDRRRGLIARKVGRPSSSVIDATAVDASEWPQGWDISELGAVVRKEFSIVAVILAAFARQPQTPLRYAGRDVRVS